MRTLTLDDLFALEQLDGALGNGQAWSPDGRWLAYVVQRSLATATTFKYPRLQGMDRADVWLADRMTGQTHNLTDGLATASGWWAPAWSPSGHRLALLSTKDGGVHLWTWTPATGAFRRIARRQIRLHFGTQPYRWLDDDRILCQLLAEGDAPVQMVLEARSADQAMAAWPEAWRGEHPTASVLLSGPDAPVREGDVTLAVVSTSEDPSPDQVVAEGLVRFATAPDVVPSPGLDQVAVLVPSRFASPVADERRTLSLPLRFRLHLYALSPNALAASTFLDDMVPGAVAWNPAGTALAGAIMRTASEEHGLAVLRYDLASATWSGLRLDGLRPTAEDMRRLCWLNDTQLILPARRVVTARRHERRDWWLLSPHHGPRCLTPDLEHAPDQVQRCGDAVVGVADGRLWRLHPNGEPQALTPAGLAVCRIAGEDVPGTDRAHVFVEVRGEAGDVLVRVPLTGDFGMHLPLARGTACRGSDPAGTTVLLQQVDDQGARLSLASVGDTDRTALTVLHRVNAWLEEIAAARITSFTYGALSGEELTGWIMLPPEPTPDRAPPLVVWAYPGPVYGPERPRHMGLDIEPAVNLHLLAAAGYAVLVPSMPQPDRDGAADPLLALPNGLLPAIDHVTAAGLADPVRVFLYGHSYGGFAVYGLLTQTTRFRAAIASAGWCDPVALHGVFDARARYADVIDVQHFPQWWTESGQLNLGNPPWRDLGRYLRNSPIAQFDRVATPLLIIHTDLDFVPIQQAEQAFSALHRQGKVVEFVRYWGESHVLQSPANIRDQWQRILDWFRRHDVADLPV